jgi:hypothetical protein
VILFIKNAESYYVKRQTDRENDREKDREADREKSREKDRVTSNCKGRQRMRRNLF